MIHKDIQQTMHFINKFVNLVYVHVKVTQTADVL